MEKKRALIVDDEETSREIALFDIQEVLDCDTAHDAFDAYNKIWQSIDAGTPYDVIVLDEVMPGMDGIALLKILRTNEKYVELLKTRPMKFVLISDVESKQYMQKIYKTVLDDRSVFIKKPLEKGLLLETIVDLLA